MLQFVAMADTMINGRPMTEYESEHAMFLMLQKLKILPKRAVSAGHWCQWSGWPMLAALAGCVTKEGFAWLHAANFFSLSCDEATTKDRSQFLSVTAYIVQNFAHVPVFLALKDIKGAGAEDLQKLIMEALLRRSDIPLRRGTSGVEGGGGPRALQEDVHIARQAGERDIERRSTNM